MKMNICILVWSCMLFLFGCNSNADMFEFNFPDLPQGRLIDTTLTESIVYPNADSRYFVGWLSWQEGSLYDLDQDGVDDIAFYFSAGGSHGGISKFAGLGSIDSTLHFLADPKLDTVVSYSSGGNQHSTNCVTDFDLLYEYSTNIKIRTEQNYNCLKLNVGDEMPLPDSPAGQYYSAELLQLLIDDRYKSSGGGGFSSNSFKGGYFKSREPRFVAFYWAHPAGDRIGWLQVELGSYEGALELISYAIFSL